MLFKIYKKFWITLDVIVASFSPWRDLVNKVTESQLLSSGSWAKSARQPRLPPSLAGMAGSEPSRWQYVYGRQVFHSKGNEALLNYIYNFCLEKPHDDIPIFRKKLKPREILFVRFWPAFINLVDFKVPYFCIFVKYSNHQAQAALIEGHLKLCSLCQGLPL